MAPNDWNVFREATERLLADDSHTIEVRFKLSVEPEQGVSIQGRLYREMEGKGMLMLDHVDGQPSHTMWVIKPLGPPVLEHAQILVPEAIPLPEETNDEGGAEEPDTPFPFDRPISMAVLLCRICENNIPEWFFEKHNETCNDVHKLEAEIGECNESIVELRNTIRDLRLALDRSSPISIPEYRGVPIFSSSSNPSLSLQMFRPPLVSKMQRMGVKKMQKRLLEQLDDILQVALEVSLPALKEEESKEPIERQRLLSPGSERKVQQVRTWNKPITEDSALMRLVNDVDTLMRTKMDNVTRLQNTIRYSEKVRQEWEEKLEATIAAMEGVEITDEDGGDEGENEEFDHDSTTSEYAFDGGTVSASEPTPIASEKPTPVPSSSSTASSQSISSRSMVRAVQQPTPVYHSQGLSLFTRSSTPSSVSSPLALAEPIVASQEPEPMSLSASIKLLEHVVAETKLEDRPSLASIETEKADEKAVDRTAGASVDKTPEPQTTDKPSDQSPATIRPKSVGALEPRVTITPPISPSIAPREGAPLRTRRLSILCPSGSSGGPLSPRIPSVMPSRSTPTSIKDFEIIKPISKGAFGSVFLAKKRVTGDYYAIKVLKKADMIAKNQITNVKAERMILMNQAESPFVAKLYFTFQSKENLYLVMEYLNGGDCAALIKSLGCLPEEWTKNYIAEVVLGLEYLHQRGIVHRYVLQITSTLKVV
jgi:serine/threonine-protein kinase RIM15